MDMSEFWKRIDAARSASEDAPDELQVFLDALEEGLAELDASEVVQFHSHLFTHFARTFHWDIIAAAVVIFGEDCDDLDIDGFRAWLISRGEAFLDRTLADVDSLGDLDLIPDDLYWIDLLNLPTEVYESLTGDDLPEEAVPLMPDTPAGEEFKLGDLPDRLPRLCDDFAFVIEAGASTDAGASTESATSETNEEESDDFAALLADVPDDENPYADTDS